MKFDLLQKDTHSKARAGSITTDHGVIETPIFMPVGTAGTVKGVHQRELKTILIPILLLKISTVIGILPRQLSMLQIMHIN